MQENEPWILDKKKKALSNQLLSISEEEQADVEREINNLQQKIDNCLHVCLQLTANLAVMSSPFLPNTAKKLCYMMKVVDKILDWENAGKTRLLSVGYSLREPQLLFRKIEDAEIESQIQKLKVKSKTVEENKKNDSVATKASIAPTNDQQPTINDALPTPINKQPPTSNEAPPAPTNDQPPTTNIVNVKPEIVFEDFAKIDLMVGTIVSAEKVEKADKLLKLQIDLGFETRTIVSGIALHYKPEDIVGKQVTVVTNLAPRKMRGIESQE